MEKTEIMAFKETIQQQIVYLYSLSKLDDNWISTKSRKPDNDSIERSVKLIEFFKKIINNDTLVVPRFILGPIISGGILLEIRKNYDNVIYISIPNNKESIIIETQKNGYFSNTETIQFSEVFNSYIVSLFNKL